MNARINLIDLTEGWLKCKIGEKKIGDVRELAAGEANSVAIFYAGGMP